MSVRLPLVEASDEEREAVRGCLERLGLFGRFAATPKRTHSRGRFRYRTSRRCARCTSAPRASLPLS